MPNWCNVNITLNHADPAMLARAVAAVENSTGLFKEFVPVPEILKDETVSPEECHRICGYTDWYNFCTSEWGTKWDLCEAIVTKNDDDSINISGETAWGPPIQVFEQLNNQGFSVTSYYYEPGMQFAGIYDNGNHEEYADWGDSTGAEEVLPSELNDFFEISVNQREIEDEDKDDLVLFIESGLENNQDTQN